MKRYLLFFTLLILIVAHPASAQKTDSTITDFRIQAMYRAAKLSWKVNSPLKTEMAVQILRADTSEEGPYKEVEIIRLTPGKTAYEYVDKSMGAEAKYFYKLVIKETNESFGPLPTRPFFSPPAT